MRTRSSSNLVGETSTNPKRRNRRRSKQIVKPFSLEETPVITSTLKYKDVPESSIKLMLFPFSIDGPARIWLDKEPSRSILTWDDLVSKFINYFFPPSKTTNLHNEISNFQQKFEETFSEACDRFKDLLRACPHHGFTELHQLDTFYNGLNSSDQDSLNSAAGGNLLERSAQDVLKIIKNKSKVRNSRNKPIVSQVKESNVDSSEIASAVASAVTSVMTAMFKQHQVTPAPASVKAVEESCVTCGGAHSYRQCLATDGNTFLGYQDNIQGYVSAATVNYNQGNTGYRPQSVANQIRPPGFAQPNVQNNQTRYNQGYNQDRGNYQGNMSYQAPIQQTQVATSSDLEKFKKTNEANIQAMRNHISNLKSELRSEMQSTMQNQNNAFKNELTKDIKNMMASFFQMNNASSSSSGSLPSNTVANPRVVDYIVDPRVPLILGRPFLRTARAFIDVYGEKLTLRIDDEAITLKVGQTSRYSYNNAKSVNQIDVIDVSCEEYAQEVLGFLDSSTSGNPTPSLDPILSTSFPSLTPFEGGDFILEEIEYCLTNDSIPSGIDDAYFDPEGVLLLLEKLLNDDPSSPLPSKELHFEEIKTIKSSIDDPPELELKDLPSLLEYAFLEGTDKLPVIISKELKDEEKAALLKVLKSHKRAIAWKISDIKGIDPSFCTHKILMEDNFKPAVQHQRRVNPKIHEVIKKEVIKLLDVGLIYPISDSPWVSPVHCVPKKGGMTVVENEDNELIPTRLVIGWRVCIDYRKLNDATHKDHFPLPFMDQMLKKFAGNEYYCFLDGFSKHFQIPIDPKDQDKTTFTCPYGTIEFDKAKVDVITKLPHPTTVKGPMTHLLEKETPFVFSKECIDAFNILKKKLTEAPILVALDWDLPFEIMCDASDYAVGAVLGKRKTKHFQPIHYASKTMTDAQAHYTTTEKELLAVVYAFEKFWPYLVLSKTIVYTDHSALKYLLAKQDAKLRLLRWILLLQEFDVIIRDKKGAENLAADHLSRLENPHQSDLEKKEITETFPLETLGMVTFRGDSSTPWIASDFEDSRARGFVHRPLDLQSFTCLYMGIRYPRSY
ncbi:reverse transcriptase domain-containing protein [Tanacetum coccineum]